MKEILIVSGKGGAGKTSITAALAFLFNDSVIADCDVDASDLHLIFEPEILEKHSFISGHEAVVSKDECRNCGVCTQVCKFDAIKKDENGSIFIDAIACEGCGVCVWSCPVSAIEFNESTCGQWFFSSTRRGPMIHAKLFPAAENSGKLVGEVRFRAKLTAKDDNADVILIDGPPGIGCPVIASMTGVDYVLLVAEPTISGMHDIKRVMDLTRHFGVKSLLCINKYDINKEVALQICDIAKEKDIPVIGKIPYDSSFTKAMIAKKTVVEIEDSAAKDALENLFINLKNEIKKGELYEKES